MATARQHGGERREGVDIGMLTVAALAAVAAAFVTSKLWPGGTLISTAMTPVIVALVKEWLRRPAERISAVGAKAPELAARVVAPTRVGPRADPQRARARVAEAPSVPTARGESERVVVPPAGSPAAGTPLEETFVEPAPGTSSQYRLYRRRGPHWRFAVITGLVAFAVAALAITVPELVLGGAVAGNGNTTVFGGGSGGASQGKSQGQKQQPEAKHPSDRPPASARQQQRPSSTPPPAGKTPPSNGSSSPAPQPSTQQPPAGAPSQGTPSTPSPSTSGQGSPGSGAGTPSPSGP